MPKGRKTKQIPQTCEAIFAYVRVSTVRQGEHGVSLQEQRDAIEQYAARNSLATAQWFEERETAAKRGRPRFSQMLQLLQANAPPE
jgi:DNA invertase Pin-like site-specific DNA recombinase